MKDINKMSKSELKTIVQDIIKTAQELRKNNVVEDSDMGLYTKSILIQNGLLDDKLL